MIGLIALLGTTIAPCLPVEGAEALWAPAHRWILVSEIHGSNEMPDAFVNLVCLAAASGRPVSVALEYSVDWQPAIDAYLRSDGGKDARAALLALSIWHEAMQDGRSSVAFLRMLDRLRQMKRAGRIAAVICSDIGKSNPVGQSRDAGMAAAWKGISVPQNGLVLALAGNAHTMRHSIARAHRTLVPAGSLMPPAATVTVNMISKGGTTWDCEADGCGEHKSGVPHPAMPGMATADADDHWGFRYELGRATTPALPAIPSSTALAKPTAVHISGD